MKKKANSNTTALLSPAQLKSYSIKIVDELYDRLEQHISLLKHLDNHGNTKQRWIIDAIKLKIEKDDHEEPEELEQGRYVHFRIDNHLTDKIERALDRIKQKRPNLSKNRLFIEAIYERLEKEEEIEKKRLQDRNQSSQASEDADD